MPPNRGYGYGDDFASPRWSREDATAVPLLALVCLVAFYGFVYLDLIPFSQALFVGLVIAFFVYVLTFLDIRFGLGIMLLAIAISPDIGGDPAKALRLEDFIIPAILFAWVTRFVANSEPFQSTPLKGPILCFLALGAISTVKGLVMLNNLPIEAAKYYGKTLQYFILYVIVLNNIRTLREVRIFMILMLLSSGVSGLYGGSRALTGDTGRLAAFDGEGANILGGFYLFHMMIALGLYVHLREPRHRILCLIYAVVIMGFPMLRTLSRASFVGMFVGVCLLGVLRKRSLLIGLLLFLFLLPIFGTHEMKFRFSTILDAIPAPIANLIPGFDKGDQPGSWEAKLWAWEKYFPIVIDRGALIGMGYGSVYMAVVDTEPLKVFCEMGFLGMILFAWLLVSILKMGWRTAQEVPDGFFRGITTGYFAGAVGLFIHALAAPSLSTIRTAEPFWFATAMVTLLHRRFVAVAESKPHREPARTGRPEIHAPDGDYAPAS